MEITVDVYGGGRRVPNGSSNPTIINQFNDELGRHQPASGRGGLSGSRSRGAVGLHLRRSDLPLHHLQRLSGTATGRVYSKLLLTGYREHFVKILIDWSQSRAAADQCRCRQGSAGLRAGADASELTR